MTITIHRDLIQGSDEWYAARLGLLTASEMKLIITPTLKVASNDKEKRHLWELAAQRITNYVEPSYVGDDMLRGMDEEILARETYAATYDPVDEAGFITNDEFGFTIGCSPDGLVGDDGGIEVKSRKQAIHMETLITQEVPTEHVLQVQTCLLVTRRKWWDFNSYCGGLPMVTLRVEPDPVIQTAIINAATQFEMRLAKAMAEYKRIVASGARLVPTERREAEAEITI